MVKEEMTRKIIKYFEWKWKYNIPRFVGYIQKSTQKLIAINAYNFKKFQINKEKPLNKESLGPDCFTSEF